MTKRDRTVPANWTWGRPDSVPTVLCSACSAALSEDDVPLMMANEAGWTVRFCEPCGDAVLKRHLKRPSQP